MRVRSRYSAQNALPWTSYRYYCNGSRTFGSAGTALATPKGEVIHDTVGSRSAVCAGFRQARFHPVEHWRWTCEAYSTAWTFWESSCQYILTNSLPFAQYTLGGNGSADIGLNFSNLAYTTRVPPVSNYYGRWQKAKPTMATRANLAVFLYELRDLKRMFEILPGKHFSLSKWRDVLRYGNNQHLNWNFGWKPFLSDVKNVFKGLSTFESRLKDFIDRSGLEQLKHQSDPPAVSDILTNWALYPWASTVKTRFHWQIESRQRSTFNFSYTLPEMSYETLRWRAYLDTLGLAATPSNIWAIIPWSFVVDWFLDVGFYLRAYESDWVEPVITLCQACTSVKTEVTAELEGVYQLGYWNESHCTLAKLHLTHYRREVGIPQLLWEDRSNLDADRLRLLASLVGSLIL